MSDARSFTIRTKKFITNPLLGRRQFVRLRNAPGTCLPCGPARPPSRLTGPDPLRRARSRPAIFAAHLAATQVVEVLHPGVAGVSKKELKEKLAVLYKVRRPPRGSQRGRTHAPRERLTRAFAAPAASRRVPRAGR